MTNAPLVVIDLTMCLITNKQYHQEAEQSVKSRGSLVIKRYSFLRDTILQDFF
jgi:hypothetical protein